MRAHLPWPTTETPAPTTTMRMVPASHDGAVPVGVVVGVWLAILALVALALVALVLVAGWRLFRGGRHRA